MAPVSSSNLHSYPGSGKLENTENTCGQRKLGASQIASLQGNERGCRYGGKRESNKREGLIVLGLRGQEETSTDVPLLKFKSFASFVL